VSFAFSGIWCEQQSSYAMVKGVSGACVTFDSRLRCLDFRFSDVESSYKLAH